MQQDQHRPEYLRINPDGTIPAMVHGQLVLTESTPMMEYIDEAFDGPPLRPTDPIERWRMRWWMRFFDAYFAPSASMIGWSQFVGPAVRERDPQELRAAIERIPLESRRVAWRKAMFNEFTQQELDESRRRCVYSTGVLEQHLSRHRFVAGTSYSLADVNGFNLAYAMPLVLPELCNDASSPHIMEWLRTIYERPATRATWAKARVGRVAERTKILERPAPPRQEGGHA